MCSLGPVQPFAPLVPLLVALAAGLQDVDALGQALRRGDRDERLAAVEALGRAGPAGAAVLGRALTDEEPVALAAAGALEALGPEAETALPELLARADDGRWRVRAAVHRALASLGEPALVPLVRRLVEADRVGQQLALLSLARTDLSVGLDGAPYAAPLLVDALGDGDLAARRGEVITQLFAVVGPRALPALSEALGDRDWRAREAYVQGAARAARGGQEVVPLLVRTATDEFGPVRRRAAWGLGWRPEAARGDDSLATLSALLRDRDPDVRLAAAWALQRIGGEGFARLLAADDETWLRVLLAGPPPTSDLVGECVRAVADAGRPALVRAHAAEVLGLLGEGEGRAGAALAQALQTAAEPEVRLACARALVDAGADAGGLEDWLRASLGAADEPLRREVYALLARSNDAEAAAAGLLDGLARENDPTTRAAIATALGQVPAAAGRTAPVLVELLDGGAPVVRAAAAGALGELGARDTGVARLAIAPLLRALQTEDEEYEPLTQAAIEALARLGEPARRALADVVDGQGEARYLAHALDALDACGADALLDVRGALRHPEPLVGVHAAAALHRRGIAATRVLQALIDGLKDPYQATRIEAARVLAALGPEAKNAVSPLLEALADPQRAVRVAVVRALAAVGPEKSAALRALVGSLEEDADSEVRRAAAEGIGDLGERAKKAIPALLAALEGDEAEVRAASARALGAIGADTRAVTDALLALLEASETPVRAAAAEALGRLGLESAVPALGRAAWQGPPQLARAAVTALGRLGPPAAAELPALVHHVLASPELATRAAAADALGRLGPAALDALPALVWAFQEEDVERGAPEPGTGGPWTDARWRDVRVAAAGALAVLGPDAAAAIDALRRGMYDPDEPVRVAAAAALEAIGR